MFSENIQLKGIIYFQIVMHNKRSYPDVISRCVRARNSSSSFFSFLFFIFFYFFIFMGKPETPMVCIKRRAKIKMYCILVLQIV